MPDALPSRMLQGFGSWMLAVLVVLGVTLGAVLLPDDLASIAPADDGGERGVATPDAAARDRVPPTHAVGRRSPDVPVPRVRDDGGWRVGASAPEGISSDATFGEASIARAEARTVGAVPSGRLPGLVEYLVEGTAFVEHRVAPRETVEQIAWRYGAEPRRVRADNGISPRVRTLEPGAVLRVEARRRVPPRVPIAYVVRPGDTWRGIAEAHGVDEADLRAYNPQVEGRLRVGEPLAVWIDPVVARWIADEAPVRPGSVRPGAVGIGPPQDGRLVNGVRLPRTEYFVPRLPSWSYGTSHAVRTFMDAVVRFEARHDYAPPLLLGAMSRRHGGPIAGHVSHQTGRDLDIRLPLRAHYPATADVVPERVDWEALWHLLTALRDTGEVIVVFFDYELQAHLWRTAAALGVDRRERSAMLQWSGGANTPGFVRHSPGHRRHIHVRFTCGPFEVECVAHADHDHRD